MNRINRLACMFAVFAGVFHAPVSALADAGPALRVDPPHWWTGFVETELQLMVHGSQISRFDVSVDAPGVTVLRTETVDNPDYLFVYLDIGKGAQAGEFNLVFEDAHRTILQPYSLQVKNPDPAHTAGFGPKDAIYLVTPDRFANGDTGNDNLPGWGDAVDRDNPGGRHGGDIRGLTERLAYIDDMGFTAIWLNPLLENRMPAYSYHGYSTTDFYSVDPRYGSNEDYRALVASARERGIGVIMDMIVNHIGSGHPWMQSLPSGDWLNQPERRGITTHERIADLDPNAAQVDRDAFNDGWFVDTMPDLNQRNPLLADYLTQNALWWIEYLGLAGIRMDTYPYPDKHYMAEWTRRVMREYPAFNVVGEEWSLNPSIVAYWQRGQHNHDGYVSWLPSLMDFPTQAAMAHALTSGPTGVPGDPRPGGMMGLYRAIANDFVYPDPHALVTFADNHDMSRITTQLGDDPALYRQAMTWLLTTRGTPQVYYGTEIMMSHTGDDSHGVIRSDFPGGWPGDPVDAVSGEGLAEAQQAAQAFLRTLLNWRRETPVVHSGKMTHFMPRDEVYAWFRHDGDDSVMVVLSGNDEPVDLPLARFAERLDGYRHATDVVSGERYEMDDAITLPARAALVLPLRR